MNKQTNKQTATTNQSTSNNNNNNNNHIQIGSTLYCVWVFKKLGPPPQGLLWKFGGLFGTKCAGESEVSPVDGLEIRRSPPGMYKTLLTMG